MAQEKKSPLRSDELDPQVCTHGTRLAVLRRVPLFENLSAEDVEAVSGYWQAREYRAAQSIYRAGDPASQLFVVATGKVKLLSYAQGGQQVVLDLLAPGETFGSLLALGDDAYANDAEAQTFCCLLTLSAETFEELLRSYPAVALAALRLTATRLREARQAVEELSTLPVEQRLAATLLKLGEKLGEKHPEGLLLQVPLPQQDLAAMTGTTPESVNRALARFRKGGLVGSGRTWLILKDRAALEAVAGGAP